jgi:ATP-dependent exoDNAse (exonuclease V) alpha subunit
MTIHKSQGQTLDVVAVDINEKQSLNREKRYVAFSRVTLLDSLYLFGDNTIIPEHQRNLE